MFAYCGNNPGNGRDTTGKVFDSLSGRGFDQAKTMQAPYGGGYSYITDQRSQATGEKSFGLVTVAHGGCGPIATYNALFSMGNYTSFDEVLAYYNRRVTRLNIGGLAGTPVSLVSQYFTDHGYTVYITDDPYEFDIYSQVADACIVWYMFPSSYSLLGSTIEAFGAHFVEYSKTSSGYIGRNTGANGLYEFTMPSDFAYRGSNYYSIGIFIFE